MHVSHITQEIISSLKRETHIFMSVLCHLWQGTQYKLWDLTSGQDSIISLHFEAL